MMFSKVLIAEDHQSASNWVQQLLKELGVTVVKYAYYCDDALLMLRRGIEEGEPFELLITDLSFVEYDREQQVKGGAALVEAARVLQPGLRTLVFSAEQDSALIGQLFQKQGINGYVCKGPRDTQELKDALASIARHKNYIPVEYVQTVRTKRAVDLTDYDILVISQLAQGMLQKNIPYYLEQKGIRPYSLSSVEKRLNQVRELLGCTKNEQLVAYCKDNNII